MSALRAIDAAKAVITGRISKHNNKAAKAARAGKIFHPEAEASLDRAKYLADELEAARADVAELVSAANRAAVMLKVAGPMCGIHALNETAFYDEAECDGACIHDDCANAAIDLDAALAKFVPEAGK